MVKEPCNRCGKESYAYTTIIHVKRSKTFVVCFQCVDDWKKDFDLAEGTVMSNEEIKEDSHQLFIRSQKWKRDITHIKNFHQLSNLLLELEDYHSGMISELKDRIEALEQNK